MQPGFTDKIARQCAARHIELFTGTLQRPAFARTLLNKIAEHFQTVRLRRWQFKRQYVHATNFIQQQFIDAFRATARRISFRQSYRTDNQFTQQR